ncbi:chromate transporter [Evansella caseinilytica]|uniref:Chromate transporter n=1 Tax=Evansella caseinilytica TaxID=1503961 RepID=A0A1H3PD25_9BACI|nr:chromate transporter [Evansella caseinilytica]SDY98961.1 chromate transporter [Evansella caseinilytica]
MLVELFFVFFIIGAVSFGGGYAMIPVIEAEAEGRGWLTTSEFTNVIAVAGMSPGPIATNSATVVGYHVAGIAGAVVSATAMTLPSFLTIFIIASVYNKFSQHSLIKAAFYGLRPAVASLIIYAAIKFAASNGIFTWNISAEAALTVFLFLLSLAALMYFRLHPALVLILSGIAGVFLFY